MTEEKLVLYEKEDDIGIITLNRPDKMNILSDDMIGVQFPDACGEAIMDTDVRAIILTGAGKAFTAGTDVAVGLNRDVEKETVGQAAKRKKFDFPPSSLDEIGFTLTRIPKPVIAAINGVAVGGGAEWVAQCDIRIASEKARIGWVFSLRGLTPDMGAGPYLLPAIVGRAKALELMYSGEIIDAWEAERIGLVSKVVPPDELMPAAKELAHKVASGAPLALTGIKELTYGADQWPISQYLKGVRERWNKLSATEDCKEGVDSFFQKRPPVWKGR